MTVRVEILGHQRGRTKADGESDGRLKPARDVSQQQSDVGIRAEIGHGQIRTSVFVEVTDNRVERIIADASRCGVGREPPLAVISRIDSVSLPSLVTTKSWSLSPSRSLPVTELGRVPTVTNCLLVNLPLSKSSRMVTLDDEVLTTAKSVRPLPLKSAPSSAIGP